MMNEWEKVQEAVAFIRHKTEITPAIGIVLGSGLGDLAYELTNSTSIPYEDIPHFPVSTVEGHAGHFFIGELGGKQVVLMQGRFHYYEGYSMKEVTFPVRVMQQLGIATFIATNACGALRNTLSPGDLLVIEDHLNLTGTNPLIGKNDGRFGPRFPDMSDAYDKELRQLAHRAAEALQYSLKQGVYAGISGPNYMTRSELIMVRELGADVVGMSTVPEVIVARHGGLRVLGISCITDMAIGETMEGISHEEVMEVAQQTKPRFMALMKKIVTEHP